VKFVRCPSFAQVATNADAKVLTARDSGAPEQRSLRARSQFTAVTHQRSHTPARPREGSRLTQVMYCGHGGLEDLGHGFVVAKGEEADAGEA
jgi:hypothetical protein